MYILGKKFCKTLADFGQISARAGGLNFGRGQGPGRSLDEEKAKHGRGQRRLQNTDEKRWLQTIEPCRKNSW